MISLKDLGKPEFFETTIAREGIATMLFAMTSVIPVLGFSGFVFDVFLDMELSTIYLLAMVGSVIALFITNLTRVIANVVGGLLLGAGITFTTIFYLEQRETIFQIELILPILLGGVPGIFAYYAVVKATESNQPENDAQKSN